MTSSRRPSSSYLLTLIDAFDRCVAPEHHTRILGDALREAGLLDLPTDTAKLEAFMAQDEPLCFGHTLTDQIGGQLDAGLALVAMYEDRWGDGKALDERIATFVATRARKLG